MTRKEKAEAVRSLIEDFIAKELPKKQIAQNLGIQQATLAAYLNELNIEYKGQQNKKGQQKGPNKYKPANYYIENSIPVSGYYILKKLLRDGLKEYRCEECDATSWLGSVDNLVLEVHHIDGNHYNNRLDNLKVLCPNCHAMYTRQMNKDTPQ